MSAASSISMTTRTSDLDSHRHVNNKIYEQFCSEGRYRLLQEHAYSIETLLNRAVTLRPVASFVKFFLQQKSGATLNIQTEAYPSGDGIILWDHHVSQPDGQAVCHLQAKTETLDRQRKPIELLPATEGSPFQLLIKDVPSFSGKCARVSRVRMRSSTRTWMRSGSSPSLPYGVSSRRDAICLGSRSAFLRKGSFTWTPSSSG